MHFVTNNYLYDETTAVASTAAAEEFGWPEVRTGLHKILKGYLVSFCAFLLILLGVVFVTVEAVKGQMFDAVIDAAMLTYFGAGVVFLMGLYSLMLLVTGKLRCLISVPETKGAKWMMFLCMLCFVACPAMDFLSSAVPRKIPPEKVRELLLKSPLMNRKALPEGPRKGDEVIQMLNEVRDFAISLSFLDGRAYLALAGLLSGLLSTTFFVLFLRAVAGCFEDSARQRFAELYLAFSTLLLVATVYVFFNPPSRVEELPALFLVLAGGWLVTGIWYILLIISASMGIAQGLALRQVRAELAKAGMEG
jgi:hypothetical protein